MFSPQRISDIMHKAAELRQQLEAEGYDLHDQLASLESETDALDLFDRYAEAVVADERLAATARERAKRLERRAEINRGMLVFIMGVLEQRKLERPLVTASIQKGRTSLEITDREQVPPEYFTELDKAAVGYALKAGNDVPGAELKTGKDFLKLSTL